MSFTYKYPHPAVSVDIIVISKFKNNKKILLIERKNPPFEKCWALPGGFIEMDETLEQSALRELKEETSLQLTSLNQFAAYGDPGRDPRERTVSVVFYTILDDEIVPCAGDDASKAKWFSIKNIPDLAFDHKKILDDFFRESP